MNTLSNLGINITKPFREAIHPTDTQFTEALGIEVDSLKLTANRTITGEDAVAIAVEYSTLIRAIAAQDENGHDLDPRHSQVCTMPVLTASHDLGAIEGLRSEYSCTLDKLGATGSAALGSDNGHFFLEATVKNPYDSSYSGMMPSLPQHVVDRRVRDDGFVEVRELTQNLNGTFTVIDTLTPGFG